MKMRADLYEVKLVLAVSKSLSELSEAAAFLQRRGGANAEIASAFRTFLESKKATKMQRREALFIDWRALCAKAETGRPQTNSACAAKLQMALMKYSPTFWRTDSKRDECQPYDVGYEREILFGIMQNCDGKIDSRRTIRRVFDDAKLSKMPD